MASPFKTIDLERIEASQYVSAAGLVILLWDHVLTFPDEVQLIWKARLSIAKVLFLLNRYMVPLAMILESHEFSGATRYLSLSVSSCKVWYAIGVTVGMLSVATSNFLILLRLWVIWDRSPRLVLSTLTFFVVAQLVALGCATYVIYDMLPTLFVDPILHVCIPISKPKFVLLWIPGIAFEFVVFLTTLWNALDQPRSRNVRMTKIVYRDGGLYFFGLFALRLLNMMVCILEPASLTFLGVFFLWSVSNITLSRLIFNLRRMSGETVGHSDMQACPEEEKLAEDGDGDGDEVVVVADGGGVQKPTGPPMVHKSYGGRPEHGRHDSAWRRQPPAQGLLKICVKEEVVSAA